MDIDKETEKQIQELQLLERSLQSILMQKQAFQLELSEIENSLKEIEKTKDEVYKIAGQIMIKTNKDEIIKELIERKDMLSLRLKSIEKQEEKLSQGSENLREKVLSKIKK